MIKRIKKALKLVCLRGYRIPGSPAFAGDNGVGIQNPLLEFAHKTKIILPPPSSRDLLAGSIFGFQEKDEFNINKKTPIQKVAIFLVSAFALYSAQSFAIPVEDFGAYTHMVQELSQLEKEYSLLQDAYKNAQDQLAQQKQLVSDSEGHYNVGSMLNGQSELTQREWSPNTWDAALHGLSGGNPDRYNQLLSDYKKNHPTLSAEEFQKGASGPLTQVYQQQINTNQAADVNATYAFNDIQQSLKNVHDLSDQIEKSPNTKASMDLNARLLAEVAYIQIQELKMQAILNEQVAQQNAEKISAETESAKFNRLPDEP